MDKKNIKKLMLLKKEKGEAVAEGSEGSARKKDEKAGTCSTGNRSVESAMEAATVQLFRVLAVEDERVLVIDCIKKTMPVWMDMEQMNDFIEADCNGDALSAQNKDSLQQQDLDALDIIALT